MNNSEVILLAVKNRLRSSNCKTQDNILLMSGSELRNFVMQDDDLKKEIAELILLHDISISWSNIASNVL